MPDRHDRILALDVIRGIALFGILIVNMMSFHSPILYYNPFKWWTSSMDRITYIMIDLFFQASFYPMYSLLFGYSLAIFRERVLDKKLPFNRIVSRRFVFLFFIGFLHAFFIWHGDILMVYAIIGFLSLPFFRMAPKLLILSGSSLYVIANTLFALFLALRDFIDPSTDGTMDNNKLAKAIVEIYQQGTFAEITRQRALDWMTEYNPQALILLFFTVFPLFLIGMGLSKLKVLEKMERDMAGWKRIFVWTFLLGLMFKCLPYMCGRMDMLNYFQDTFGGVFQAVSYASLFVLLLCKKRPVKFFIVFSSVGKMSLTNYLIQSSLASLIFYGYGLRLYGKISLTFGVLLALGIFVFQVIFCTFWLRFFTNGPLEWLWRCCTYLQFLRIKLSNRR